MTLDFSMEHFNSAEAETITDVSQMLQRSYRRRGFLPPQPGRARYTAFDLARLLFLRTMAIRGLEILLAERFAGRVAEAVTFYAMAKGPVGVDYDLARQALDVLRRHAPTGSDRAIVVPVRFFVLWAGNSASWLSKLEGDLFEQGKGVGPVLIFDQRAAGEALRQRAGRPLVRVSGMPQAASVPRAIMDAPSTSVECASIRRA